MPAAAPIVSKSFVALTTNKKHRRTSYNHRGAKEIYERRASTTRQQRGRTCHDQAFGFILSMHTQNACLVGGHLLDAGAEGAIARETHCAWGPKWRTARSGA
eukprot:gb/GEZJ01004871.1/.p5 GENE.gb/GEZJ01004871.1/~~gb/GEZJ01004871.1/.p5  ORF type:complete len:102 (+),score=5.45 gb/GEZJ01004871.1/:665-970(+)